MLLSAARRLGHTGSDEIQEAFLNEIFLQLAYKTYTPGEVLINFSDPPDELLIIVDGKVQVEFEHPSVQRHSIVLKEGSVGRPPLPASSSRALSRYRALCLQRSFPCSIPPA